MSPDGADASGRRWKIRLLVDTPGQVGDGEGLFEGRSMESGGRS